MLFENFENWEDVGRCGNFLIKHNTDEELDYYAVKVASGHLSFVFRQDHPWWSIFDMYAKGDISADVVETSIILLFMQTTVIPDEKFLKDYMEIYKATCARYEGGFPKFDEDDCESVGLDEKFDDE